MTTARRTTLIAMVLTALSFQISAAPIVGNTYLDGLGDSWVYIGSFKVTDGPNWYGGIPTYNGLEAAELVFGALLAGESYATSTDDAFVDHLAWYDGWGQTQHLDNGGTNVGLAEDLITDPNANGYNFAGVGNGEFSAYIRDHVTAAQNSVNYVFKSVAVPAPAGLALFGLGLVLVGASRRKASAS